VDVIELRAFTYERQRLGRAAPNGAAALRDVIGVYSAHPSAPLSLHARAAKFDGAAFRRLKAIRLPAMRQAIHLLPEKSAHLAFRATPAPASDRAKRFRHFKLTDKRYETLRKQLLAAAREPLTQEELRDAVGAEDAKELKGVSAQMTRDGELVRVAAGKSLRSNELRYQAAEIADADADEALAWLAGEYLRAFGPIRVKDFTWWAGTTATRAKAALGTHETEELDDGYLILAKDRAAFEKATPPKGAVDLLPKWDCLQMGYAPDGRDRFAHPDVIDRCYDVRGDGVPVILVDGEAAGIWPGGEIELFDTATKKIQAAIEKRLGEVTAFLDT
jgi:winged helix DNA-binding protein